MAQEVAVTSAFESQTKLLDERDATTSRALGEMRGSVNREFGLIEQHRLELKSDGEQHRRELKADGEKTLATATIAAEKAVQAALAAAEKARDQQTIASQLATEKAEKSSKEQMEQQGATFTTAIAGLSVGFQDVKGMLGELRAERRGGQEQVTERRAGNSQTISIVAVAIGIFGGAITAILVRVMGA